MCRIISFLNGKSEVNTPTTNVVLLLKRFSSLVTSIFKFGHVLLTRFSPVLYLTLETWVTWVALWFSRFSGKGKIYSQVFFALFVISQKIMQDFIVVFVTFSHAIESHVRKCYWPNLSQYSISIPPANVRKLLVFWCCQGE